MKRPCSNCGTDTPVSGPGCRTPHAWCKMPDCQKAKRRHKNQSFKQSEKYKIHLKNKWQAYRGDTEKLEHIKKLNNGYRIKLRLEMIEAYGGRCAFCGDDRKWALQLDHTRDNGAEDRKARSQTKLYHDLRRAGYPRDGYQLLCATCNFGKNLYGIEFVLAETILRIRP